MLRFPDDSATAREITLSKLSITAQISPDREKMMESAKSSSGTIDRSKLKGTQLSLAQLKKYAKASAEEEKRNSSGSANSRRRSWRRKRGGRA